MTVAAAIVAVLAVVAGALLWRLGRGGAAGSPHARSLERARAFLGSHRIAIAGVSRNERELSRMILAELVRRGYDVVPIHPAAETIAGRRCHPRVSDATPPVDAVLVMTAPRQAEGVVRDALEAGVRKVWFHRGAGAGSASPAALAACAEHGVEPVTDLCPFMALPGSSAMHRVHGALRGLRSRAA